MIILFAACTSQNKLVVEVVETSASGNNMTPVEALSETDSGVQLQLLPEQEFQTITGFGGSFTESSAYLLNQLGKANRKKNHRCLFWP